MVNRIGLAALLLALAAPSWAAGQALQDARRLTNANALATYDGGCAGGSCGAQEPVCEDEACRVHRAAEGAPAKGVIVVAEDRGARPVLGAEVPNPALSADKTVSQDKPGFLRRLFSAVIGGLLGAGGGFFLSKMLAK